MIKIVVHEFKMYYFSLSSSITIFYEFQLSLYCSISSLVYVLPKLCILNNHRFDSISKIHLFLGLPRGLFSNEFYFKATLRSQLGFLISQIISYYIQIIELSILQGNLLLWFYMFYLLQLNPKKTLKVCLFAYKSSTFFSFGQNNELQTYTLMFFLLQSRKYINLFFIFLDKSWNSNNFGNAL